MVICLLRRRPDWRLVSGTRQRPPSFVTQKSLEKAYKSPFLALVVEFFLRGALPRTPLVLGAPDPPLCKLRVRVYPLACSRPPRFPRIIPRGDVYIRVNIRGSAFSNALISNKNASIHHRRAIKESYTRSVSTRAERRRSLRLRRLQQLAFHAPAQLGELLEEWGRLVRGQLAEQ